MNQFLRSASSRTVPSDCVYMKKAYQLHFYGKHLVSFPCKGFLELSFNSGVQIGHLGVVTQMPQEPLILGGKKSALSFLVLCLSCSISLRLICLAFLTWIHSGIYKFCTCVPLYNDYIMLFIEKLLSLGYQII